MKIRHIYITKEGEPMANPEMEYPGDINPSTSTVNDVNQFNKYHSGLLPFEDRESVERLLPRDAFEFFPSNGNPFGGGYRPKPDTTIPVDIEVEVVKQKIAAHENSDKSWGPVVREGHKLFQYRKVLRIKN